MSNLKVMVIFLFISYLLFFWVIGLLLLLLRSREVVFKRSVKILWNRKIILEEFCEIKIYF